jgi:hypothetical protein
MRRIVAGARGAARGEQLIEAGAVLREPAGERGIEGAQAGRTRRQRGRGVAREGEGEREGGGESAVESQVVPVDVDHSRPRKEAELIR